MTAEEKEERRKEANRKAAAKYRQKNLEKVRQGAKEYQKNVRQSLPEVSKKRDEKNRKNRDKEKLDEYRRKSAEKSRMILSDAYVGTVLVTRLAQQCTAISKEDIPPEVVHLKKGLLMLKRLMMEKGLMTFRGMDRKREK